MAVIILGCVIYYIGAYKQPVNYTAAISLYSAIFFIADLFFRPDQISGVEDALAVSIVFGVGYGFIGAIGLIVGLWVIKKTSPTTVEYKTRRNAVFLFLSRLAGMYLVVVGIFKGIVVWIIHDALFARGMAMGFGVFFLLFCLAKAWPKSRSEAD